MKVKTWAKYAIPLFLVLTLGITTFLSGCAQPAPSPTPTKPAPAPAPTAAPSPSPAPKPSPTPSPSPAAKTGRVPFDKQELPKFLNSGASPGGESQIMQSGISMVISKYTTMKANVTLIPGFKNQIEPLRKGELDFLFLSPPSMVAAYTGTFGLPKLRLRYLMAPSALLGANCLGIWVLESSDIKEGKDLKGKKVAVDPGASWNPILPKGVMNAHGWTEKDFTRVDYSNKETAFSQLSERRVDAVVSPAGTETLQASKTMGIRLLPLTKEETTAIMKLEPNVDAGMTPEDYMGTGKSRWGIMSFNGMWSRADLNEKTTYTMLKTLFEHLDEFHATHERTKIYKFETAASDNGWKVPFHPGAVRYYKEKGLWKAENTTKQKQLLETEKKIFGSLTAEDEEAFKELGILP